MTANPAKELVPVPDIISPNKTLLLPIGRNKLLRHIPKNAKVAEIGVYKGKFSKKILRMTRPSTLSLIDAWDIDVERGHIPHKDQLDKTGFNSYAKKLPLTLKPYSLSSRIKTHHGLSVPMARNFEDGELDWIYVDADHSYEGVLADLEAWSKKVRPDGLIFGHDFTNQPSAIRDGFGVIKAVQDFVTQHGYHFLLLTTDYFPTFVLCKDPNGFALSFMKSLVASQKSLIKVNSDMVFGVTHNRFARNKNKTGILCDYEV